MNRLTRLLAELADPYARQTSAPPRQQPRQPAPPPGLYLGMGRYGPVTASPQHHVLVLGPPRSGKTSRILVPAVNRHAGPAVITSTKADILKTTLAARVRRGQCWYWDPSGTTVVPDDVQPLRWSPVDDCEHWDIAVARARSLTVAARPNAASYETHWIERGQALLAPLLHAAALGGADLAVLLSWLHRRELDVPTSILEDHRSGRAANILHGICHTDSRELSSIFSTADGVLAAYRSDTALQATRNPNFDPDLFASSKDTIYIVSPAATQALHASIVVALLDQIRTATYRFHPRPPMLYALDELANIAPIADLPATLAEGGSQGLTVMACLQDLSQARSRWGAAADGYLTLFTHKVVLSGIADTATLKAISALAGEIDVPSKSVSKPDTFIGQSTTTWSLRRQPRLPLDAIAAGIPGRALLISGTTITQVDI